jgi:heme/copper-type cytochrome/quinol oxidase subunit 2
MVDFIFFGGLEIAILVVLLAGIVIVALAFASGRRAEDDARPDRRGSMWPIIAAIAALIVIAAGLVITVGFLQYRARLETQRQLQFEERKQLERTKAAVPASQQPR